MPDEVLRSILQRLADLTGVSFGAKSFEARLRTQKSVYLLQQMGAPQLQKYGFHNYVHGPYSLKLGTEYCSAPLDVHPKRKVSPGSDIERVIAEVILAKPPFLEAAAMAVMVNRVEGVSQQEALLERVLSIKPHTHGVAADAVQWAQESRLIFPRGT